MSRPRLYTQCRLEKPSAAGALVDVSWIPSEYAKLNKVLRIKDPETGEWSDGWVVKEKWSTREASYVEAQERDYTKQRDVSDI